MMTNIQKTTPLGVLIAAEFDRASLSSNDPLEVSRLALQAIALALRSALRLSVSLSLPGLKTPLSSGSKSAPRAPKLRPKLLVAGVYAG